MRRVTWALAVGVLALPMAAWAASADQEVAQQIADSLRQSGRLKGYSIAVKYKDGTARLEGTVRAPQQAEQATELANQHPSVKRVINNLAVDASPIASQPESRPAPTEARPGQVEARPASTQLPSHPASALMSRGQPQTAPLPPQQASPRQVATMPPQAAEQPFRQVSMPRTVAQPVAAPQMQQPMMARAPAGLQPAPNARPIQSVMAQQRRSKAACRCKLGRRWVSRCRNTCRVVGPCRSAIASRARVLQAIKAVRRRST